LEKLVLEHHRIRRDSSATHLITLLGISLKLVAAELLDELRSAKKPESCVASLESTLAEHRETIDAILRSRRNSFTGARRFLAPQVLLGAYFAGATDAVDFADLGTGLGVLPRQLNARGLFDAFKAGLRWPEGTPAFRAIPFRSRFGVDHGPLPEIDWVRACYGTSPYYDGLYLELLDMMNDPDVRSADVRYAELDLLDTEALSAFLRRHSINVVNLSYALYELDVAGRAKVVDTLLNALRPPGVVVVVEPHAELTQPGCTVSFRDHRSPDAKEVLWVSDGHFTGRVEPARDYGWFTANHPIQHESAVS
jgi:hypothetical protein